ncbi:acetyltransferase (GNAT) domain-containing protein [Sarocladium implicatum]|jgi:GNAT superfamily N-acetyltransferase|nr:acetyltransferase (GNAT) domain-containing protein [Sarocladium implicatum]
MAAAPFALLAEDLFILPTPQALDVQPYRTLFRDLHADPDFCQVAFGPHFSPIVWSDEEVRDTVLRRDATLRWGNRGMGDFGLAIVPGSAAGQALLQSDIGKTLQTKAGDVRFIEGDEYDTFITKDLLDSASWVGYTCVRDATTAGGSITQLYEDSSKDLPPWQEMIEIRYGMEPNFRGRGIATRAANIVMDWAVDKFGVTRFVAETEPGNHKSQKILTRLGFERADEVLFGEGAVEWRRSVARQP